MNMNAVILSVCNSDEEEHVSVGLQLSVVNSPTAAAMDGSAV